MLELLSNSDDFIHLYYGIQVFLRFLVYKLDDTMQAHLKKMAISFLELKSTVSTARLKDPFLLISFARLQ